MERHESDFYGPVLNEVHQLEQHVAQYPRIVLSTSAIEFCGADFHLSSHPLISSLIGDTLEACRSLTHLDADGRTIVDFMGPGLHDLLKNDLSLAQKGIPKAFEFVRGECARFEKVGDTKHSGRYHQLLHYMESRYPIWERDLHVDS